MGVIDDVFGPGDEAEVERDRYKLALERIAQDGCFRVDQCTSSDPHELCASCFAALVLQGSEA